MPDMESRFFRWCWNQLTPAQRDAMWVVARTAAPNGQGVGHHMLAALELIGMIKVETDMTDWRSTFTDLGESVMWEGATLETEQGAKRFANA